jgi:hypothetical protein
VYSAGGHRVVAGSERGPGDLYLYDFELAAIAQDLASGRTRSLDPLASLLAHAGFTRQDGVPLDAASLQALLSSAIRAALATPAAPGALEPLLLRQLGLQHATPNDLATAGPAQLDALQLVLITADLLGTPLHAAPLPAVAHSLPSVRVHQAGCGDFGTPPLPNTWTLSWLSDRSHGSLMTSQVQTGTINDTFHGGLLGLVALQTDVETPTGLDSHCGPAGHAPNAGTPLVFRVHVTLQVPSPVTVTCGSLDGLDVPPPGPLPNVLVSMDTGGLEKYGAVTYAPSDRHTASDGVVTMTFTPRDEAVPGYGQEITASDFLQVSTTFHAYDTTRFGQFLDQAGAAIVPLHWSVARHAPRGFQFSATWSDYRQDPDDADPDAANDAGETIDLSGHVCGEDPSAGAWQWTQAVTAFDHSDGPDNAGKPVTVSVPFTQGMRWGTGTVTLVPGPPAQMRIDDQGGTGLTVGQPVTLASLQDPADCPPPVP